MDTSEALSISLASVGNVIPEFKDDYVKLEPLQEAVRELGALHLGDNKASLRHKVKNELIPALKLKRQRGATLEESSALLEAGRGQAHDSRDYATLSGYYGAIKKDNINFLQVFEKQVKRVENKYNSALDKLCSRLVTLQGHIEHLVSTEGKANLMSHRREVTPEFVHLYRKSLLIENFAMTNYCLLSNFTRLKKVQGQRCGDSWLGSKALGILDASVLSHANKNDQPGSANSFTTSVNKMYAGYFCNGDEQYAEFQMLLKQRPHMDWDMLMVGIWVGAALMGLLGVGYWLLILDVEQDEHDVDIPAKLGGFRVFQSVGLVLLMFVGFSGQVAVWRERRINMPVIFGVPSNLLPPTSGLFRLSAKLTVFYLLWLSIYLHPPTPLLQNVAPCVTLCTFGACLFGAWYRTYWLTARISGRSFSMRVADTLRSLFIFILGLSESSFLAAYVTDYLTSSSKILANLARVACNLAAAPEEEFAQEPFLARFSRDNAVCTSGMLMNDFVVPVIMLWPLWLRLGQNLVRLYETRSSWPFLANAAKYALAHSITVLSVVNPGVLTDSHGSTFLGGLSRAQTIFASLFVLTSLVTFLWDVLVDWGLGDLSNGGLRPVIMLKNRAFYYVSVVMDFVLRFSWTVQLIPTINPGSRFSLSADLLQVMEVMRRTVWGIIRLDNEMTSNTKQYAYFTSADTESHYIPLYFDTPFHQRENKHAPSSRPAWATYAEIAVVLLVVAIFAFITIFVN